MCCECRAAICDDDAICATCGSLTFTATELPAAASASTPRVPRVAVAIVGAALLALLLAPMLPPGRSTDHAMNRVRNARYAACGAALDVAAPAHLEIVDAIVAATRGGFAVELGGATELPAIAASIEIADATSRPALARRWRAVLGCG